MTYLEKIFSACNLGHDTIKIDDNNVNYLATSASLLVFIAMFL